MTEMVERVARALAVADGMHPEAVSNDEDQTPVWTLYVDDARAAIEAMREPSKQMVLEIAAADWKGKSDLNWSDGWRIMIDAALSRPTPEKE